MRERASHTAEAVCLMRAREQLRDPAHRILHDPYAAAFLSPAGRLGLRAAALAPAVADAAEVLASGLQTYVLARHATFDHWLHQALAQGAEQVVLLGAGYDTRAWRMSEDLAGRPIFEVDHPATSRRKTRLLAEAHQADGPRWPEVRREVVECDFESERFVDRLRDRGFHPERRTFWIWEGVTMYLRRAAVVRTLEDLAAHSAPGSGLAMDLWYLLDDPDLRATFLRASANLLSLLGEPVTFGLHPDDAEDFLARRGLHLRERAEAGDLQRDRVPDDRPVYPAIWCCRAEVAARP